MQKARLFFLIFAIIYVPSCSETEIEIEEYSGSSYISMTTIDWRVGFYIEGSGPFNINWGDGSVEKGKLVPSDGIGVSHSYRHTISPDIKISGNLKSLGIGGQITILNASNNEELFYLSCQNCQITSLDVSKNTKLTFLDCYGNRLTSMDLTVNRALRDLNCRFNQLDGLDLSNNVALRVVRSCYNQLTFLDVSNNVTLEEIYCAENKLTSLDVTNNHRLRRLNLSDNKMDIEALNDLFESLHDNNVREKIISITGNPGANYCDKRIAIDKGWTFVEKSDFYW